MLMYRVCQKWMLYSLVHESMMKILYKGGKCFDFYIQGYQD